jgi:hypothetical protein
MTSAATNAAILLLALLATSSPAQEGGAAAPPPRPAPVPVAPGPDAAGGSGAATALPQLAPALLVAGLTPENAEAVGEALDACSSTTWTCAVCARESEQPAECCGQPRDVLSGPVLGSAAPNPSASTISFLVAPGRSVRLSTLVAALEPLQVRVMVERVHLSSSGRIALQLEGLAGDEDARSAAQALEAAGLFRQLEVEPDTDGRARLVVKASAAVAPSVAQVRAALAAACPAARLVDVCWSGTPRA